MIGLFFLTHSIDEIYYQSPTGKDTWSILSINVTIPALINVVLILICDELYD